MSILDAPFFDQIVPLSHHETLKKSSTSRFVPSFESPIHNMMNQAEST